MRIRLPLTLAIIEGFQVLVGDSSFIMPQEMGEECVELDREDAASANQFVDLRGKLLPYVRLREVYGLGGTPPRLESIVVVRGIGLVVDQLLGGLQTVIKPLPRLFGCVNGIGGSTILGSGRVALIVDVASLVRQCLAARSAPEFARGTTVRRRASA
jgi:two-component system chemotaxis sensor kinase CheA